MKNATQIASPGTGNRDLASGTGGGTTSPEVLRPTMVDDHKVEAERRLLFSWLHLLWNERRLLARGVAAGMALGLILAIALHDEYQASTQLMPPDNQSHSGLAMFAALSASAGSGLGAAASDLLGAKSSGALFIGILRSRTLQDRIVDRFDLKRIYGAQLNEDARGKLSANTAISEDRKSGIITIVVTDRDPKRASAIAQAYVDELEHLVSELSTSTAHRERIFLEERLKAVKQDLDQAAQEFSQFASKTGAIDVPAQGRAMVQGAVTLQGQLIAAQAELSGLEQIYTTNNVRVRALRARIAQLQRELDKVGGQENDSAEVGEDQKSTYPSIRKLPLLGVTYSDLYRRTKIEEVVFETLTQQYELAKVQEAKETLSVKALDSATVPERKSYPPRLKILLLCMASGWGVAAAWVFTRKRWHEAAADDPGKVFAKEVFQTVHAYMPWATPNGSRVQAMTHRIWVRLSRQSEPAEASEESPPPQD